MRKIKPEFYKALSGGKKSRGLTVTLADDITTEYLEQRDSTKFYGSIAAIANKFDAPERRVKDAIRRMVEAKIITLHQRQRGPGSISIYTINPDAFTELKTPDEIRLYFISISTRFLGERKFYALTRFFEEEDIEPTPENYTRFGRGYESSENRIKLGTKKTSESRVKKVYEVEESALSLLDSERGSVSKNNAKMIAVDYLSRVVAPNPGKHFTCDVNWLTEVYQLSEEEVKNAITELRKAGFIKHTKIVKGVGKSSVYEINRKMFRKTGEVVNSLATIEEDIYYNLQGK